MDRLRNVSLTWLLFIAFFSFPLVDYLLRTVLGIPLLGSLWDELVLITLLVMLGLHWLVGEADMKELREIDVTKPMLLIVLYAVALIFLDIPYLSIGIEGFRASFQYLFAFFAAFFLLRDQRRMLTMIYIMIAIGLLMGLHGVYQYIAGVPMPGNWVDAGENVRTRAFSFVGSPNVLGSYMAFTIPMACGMAFYWLQMSWKKTASIRQTIFSKSGLVALLFIGAAGVMALCLLVTFSRGALLAFGASLALVATMIAVMYDKRFLFVVLGAGAAGALLVYILAPTVVERLLYVFSPEYFAKSSQGGRVTRWLNAFDRMRHEPFFGAGLGQYGGAVGARHFGTIYVDNYYAKTLAEMGLVGISLFLWLITAVVKNAFQSWRKVWNSSYRFLAAGLFAGLLAVIFHNAVENIFEVPFMNVLFWMTAGMLLGLPFTKQEVGHND